MSKRTPYLYFADIVKAIDHIYQYTEGVSFEEFRTDSMRFEAVMRNFQIIGDAIKQVSQMVEEQEFSSDIEWQNVVDMRNLIVHEYFGVNVELVWNTIEDYLPSLREEMVRMKERYS